MRVDMRGVDKLVVMKTNDDMTMNLAALVAQGANLELVEGEEMVEAVRYELECLAEDGEFGEFDVDDDLVARVVSALDLKR